MYFCTPSLLEGVIKFSMIKFSMDLLNLLLYYSPLIVMGFSSSHLGVDIQVNTKSTKHDFNKYLSGFYCNLTSIASNYF